MQRDRTSLIRTPIRIFASSDAVVMEGIGGRCGLAASSIWREQIEPGKSTKEES